MTGYETPLFFDWLRTPIDAVAPLIESRFRDAFDPAALIWKDNAPYGWQVTDTRYDLFSEHWFRTREPAQVQTTFKMIRRSAEAFLDLIEGGGEPVVFVRRWDPHDTREKQEAAARDLHKFLSRISPRCVMLYLRMDESAAVINDRFISCYNPITSPEWYGEDAIYEWNFRLADRVCLGQHQ